MCQPRSRLSYTTACINRNDIPDRSFVYGGFGVDAGAGVAEAIKRGSEGGSGKLKSEFVASALNDRRPILSLL